FATRTSLYWNRIPLNEDPSHRLEPAKKACGNSGCLKEAGGRGLSLSRWHWQRRSNFLLFGKDEENVVLEERISPSLTP
ncbi:hypothetical protein, partial [Cesiribacter andamanensis]|uniref:hypothetical protein n=1 Tax=Cesiribacter andamanensis TaxID=649507 RepID=UPI001F452214